LGTLRRLKENSIKLAVISNFDIRLRNTLSFLGFREIFDEIIIFAEAKSRNQAPEFFSRPLKR